MKKTIASLLATCLCMACMCIPVFAAERETAELPDGWGDVLGYESPDAVYTVEDAKPKTGYTTMAAKGYTDLWSVTVISLGPGNLMSTVNSGKTINHKYTALHINGTVRANAKVGACYTNEKGQRISIGDKAMTKANIFFPIKHVGGSTTYGFVRNTHPSNTLWECVFAFAGK